MVICENRWQLKEKPVSKILLLKKKSRWKLKLIESKIFSKRSLNSNDVKLLFAFNMIWPTTRKNYCKTLHQTLRRGQHSSIKMRHSEKLLNYVFWNWNTILKTLTFKPFVGLFWILHVSSISGRFDLPKNGFLRLKGSCFNNSSIPGHNYKLSQCKTKIWKCSTLKQNLYIALFATKL